MGKLKVITNLTLDGVMQSPGRVDEDPRDGFAHGGWAAPYAAMQQPEVGEAFANMEALLFGRLTYGIFHDYWPKQTGNPFTAFLDNIRKYVVSTTLDDPLPWNNSTLIKNDVPETLDKLKCEQAGDIVVFGSGLLVQSLIRQNLIDELTLLIHPLVLGSGRRLLSSDGLSAVFELRNAKTTSNGVLVATYKPSESVWP